MCERTCFTYTLFPSLLLIYDLLLQIYEIVKCLVSWFGTVETATQIGDLMKTRFSHSQIMQLSPKVLQIPDRQAAARMQGNQHLPHFLCRNLTSEDGQNVTNLIMELHSQLAAHLFKATLECPATPRVRHMVADSGTAWNSMEQHGTVAKGCQGPLFLI